MAIPADINQRIVESLYGEGLALADALRSRFGTDFAGAGDVALACEGLRATTRTMHCLAWLLNHRAYLAGEISEFQLRRHGRLPAATPSGDSATIPEDAARLARASERLFARVERLERAWRHGAGEGPSAIERLRARVASG